METAVEQQYAPVTSAPQLPVTSETVGEMIRHIEAKHDLLQYEIDGWCVWPALRFSAAMALLEIPFSKSKESFRFRELVAIAAKDFPRLLFPGRSRYAVVTFSSALMEEEGDRFKDVFFDDLLQELGSFFKIEKLNNKSFLPRSEAALFKRDVTSTAFDLLSGLVLPRIRRPRRISEIAEKLSASLSREPGLQAFSAHRVAAELEIFYWNKRLYSGLFGRVKPRYLLTADGYSDHAVIAAAKERGIKVCEFQHGGFIRGGPEYGWSSYAASYRARMPVPDQLFLFGDYWKEQLEDDGFWKGHLQAVGNMRIDQYRKIKNHSGSHRQADACHMVLTTQGIDTPKLLAFINDFLRLAASQLDIHLSIKLHPAFESDKGRYERELLAHAQQVRIIAGSEAPSTFELLTAADLHLSISSNCHYDALGLGVPTVILPLANSDWVLPLYRAGHAFLAPTPEALLEIVSQLNRSGVPDAIGAYYFKPGAVENIRKALEA